MRPIHPGLSLTQLCSSSGDELQIYSCNHMLKEGEKGEGGYASVDTGKASAVGTVCIAGSALGNTGRKVITEQWYGIIIMALPRPLPNLDFLSVGSHVHVRGDLGKAQDRYASQFRYYGYLLVMIGHEIIVYTMGFRKVKAYPEVMNPGPWWRSLGFFSGI